MTFYDVFLGKNFDAIINVNYNGVNNFEKENPSTTSQPNLKVIAHMQFCTLFQYNLYRIAH